MPKGGSARTSKISIKKVGMVTLAILAFLLIVYVFTPSSSYTETYQGWIKVNDKDWFEPCASHPGGQQHKTQWGETIYYGWEKNKSCVWKDGGGKPATVPATASAPQSGGGGGRRSGGSPVCSSNSDPDGDGWGWENNASCKMPWLADRDEGKSGGGGYQQPTAPPPPQQPSQPPPSRQEQHGQQAVYHGSQANKANQAVRGSQANERHSKQREPSRSWWQSGRRMR
jgi:hypothetical protein